MDDKGFIFSVDATLALIVVIVLTATVTAYTVLPYYQGEDHQHLETLADSILETMEQSGQLRTDAVYYSGGNATLIAKANADLNSTLGTLVPSGIAYKITMNTGTSYVVQNTTGNRNILTSNDIATKVKVISGPQEGWVGRAYYKIEQVQFEDQNNTAVTTLWNFHNWLQNFDPWNNGLDDRRYWGGNDPSYSSQVPKSISFYINGSSINGAKFLLGGAYEGNSWDPSAYGANFILNSNYIKHNITSANFGNALYYTTSGNTRRYMYNYMGNIDKSELGIGSNNFFINFTANSNQRLPWFSIIGNYTTTMKVPVGILTGNFSFPDIAGAGNPSGSTSILYNLNGGTVTSVAGNTIKWSDIQTKDIDTSKPFQIIDIPYGTSTGSAVASVSNVYLPSGTRLFDAYTVINPYGGVDRAIVQVKNSKGAWQTIFTSFGSYTDRTDGGYGNIPGILNIGPYLTQGNNQVRIIIWDDAPSGDNDLVGLTNCYTQIKYSQLPIRWDTFSFVSKQYATSTATQTRDFNIESEAQEVLLFVGTGLDTRGISVTVKDKKTGATSTLYDEDSVPFFLDLGNLDASQTSHIMTTINPNGTYQPKPGNYTLSLTVTPGTAYESGDYGGQGRPSGGVISYSAIANPEIFSGTRISVIYPKFLASIWADSFASNPEDAKANATASLISKLETYGYSVDRNQIKTEAIYSGDVPNSIPVRLELWKQ
ncbi:hypothetical protein [Methanobacterium sp.]|uniref:hypothetical protein n=1 Tax=Methanobacterium sp. TaxID=2164 RepID=UPI003C721B5C